MRLPIAVCLAALVAACAKSESGTADSAATAAVGPAPLTEAELAGTWTGTMKADGSDSVMVHWTQVCAAGACKGTAQEAPDTIPSTYTIAGDSTIGVTPAYADATTGGVKVIDNWVARVSGPAISGRGWMVLADKPDSVVLRYTFEGTKK